MWESRSQKNKSFVLWSSDSFLYSLTLRSLIEGSVPSHLTSLQPLGQSLGEELGISKAVEVWNWPVWLACPGASVKARIWLEWHFFLHSVNTDLTAVTGSAFSRPPAARGVWVLSDSRVSHCAQYGAPMHILSNPSRGDRVSNCDCLPALVFHVLCFRPSSLQGYNYCVIHCLFFDFIDKLRAKWWGEIFSWEHKFNNQKCVKIPLLNHWIMFWIQFDTFLHRRKVKKKTTTTTFYSSDFLWKEVV